MSQKQPYSFVIVNSYSVEKSIADLLCSDIRSCLKEALQQKLSFKNRSSVDSIFSIIVHDNTNVEVLMKPRKWDSDIYSTFHVIESIKPPRKESIQSNEPMALALEQIRKFIHQSKDSSHETKVCYISTELPDSSPKCSQLLQSLLDDNISVDFVYIPFNHLRTQEAASLNTNLVAFALSIRDYINCTLLRLDGDRLSLKRYLYQWLNCLAPSLKARISLPIAKDLLSIDCEIQPLLLPEAIIQREPVCHCHGQRVFDDSYTCRVTKSALDTSDTTQVASIGTCLFKSTIKEPIKSDYITLHCLKRIEMNTLNLGLLYGENYVVNVCTMDLEDDELEKERIKLNSFVIGLGNEYCMLVKVKEDIKNGGCEFLCNQCKHYILFPSSDNSSLLLKEIASSEMISPVISSYFTEDTKNDKIIKAIEDMPIEQYRPLLHSSLYHSAFDSLLKEKQQQPTTKITALPNKETNSIKSLRNMPTMPVRIQRIEPTIKKR